MKFDWKDSLLIAFGFVVCVAAIGFAEAALEIKLSHGPKESIAYASILGLPLVRRGLFGEPDLPAPRSGLLASSLSIVGLLFTIFGMGLLAIFGPRMFEERAPAPDFLAQERSLYDEALLLDVGDAGEDTRAAEARRRTERADLEKRIEEGAIQAMGEWKAREAAIVGRERMLSLVALGLLGLGSLAIHLRYHPRGVPQGPTTA